jgi:hypothetical protein
MSCVRYLELGGRLLCISNAQNLYEVVPVCRQVEVPSSPQEGVGEPRCTMDYGLSLKEQAGHLSLRSESWKSVRWSDVERW